MSRMRVFAIPCDLFMRSSYRDTAEYWPQTDSWYLRLCVVAREALNGGRVEAGGKPLTQKDFQKLFGIEKEWIDCAIENELLVRMDDGCIAIPEGEELYMGKMKTPGKERSVQDFPQWADFLSEWSKHSDGVPATAADLVHIAQKCGIRIIDREPTDSGKARVLGGILAKAIGKKVHGFEVHLGSKSHGSNSYFVTRTIEQTSQEDSFFCQKGGAGGSRWEQVGSSISDPQAIHKREARTGSEKREREANSDPHVPFSPSDSKSTITTTRDRLRLKALEVIHAMGTPTADEAKRLEAILSLGQRGTASLLKAFASESIQGDQPPTIDRILKLVEG